jgi:hypothetical protein
MVWRFTTDCFLPWPTEQTATSHRFSPVVQRKSILPTTLSSRRAFLHPWPSLPFFFSISTVPCNLQRWPRVQESPPATKGGWENRLSLNYRGESMICGRLFSRPCFLQRVCFILCSVRWCHWERGECIAGRGYQLWRKYYSEKRYC